MGHAQKQTKNELRKAIERAALLLRQKYHSQDCWKEVNYLSFSKSLPFLKFIVMFFLCIIYIKMQFDFKGTCIALCATYMVFWGIQLKKFTQW